jgi:hypothetical protein
MEVFWMHIQNGPNTERPKHTRPSSKMAQTKNDPRTKTAQAQNGRGLYFGPKKVFIPLPLSENNIYSPFTTQRFYCAHFAIILPYLAFFFYPFTSHFLFFYPLSSFFFCMYSTPLSLPLFIFFPQMTSADIPPGGG